MTSGLESWDNEYNDDPAWQSIEEMIDLLRNSTPNDDDERNRVDRLVLTLKMVLGYRETPSILVTPNMMSVLNQGLGYLRSQVTSWESSQQPQYLNDAMANLYAHVCEAMRGWPQSSNEGIQRAAATLREANKASTKQIETQREQMNAVLKEFESRWEEIEAGVNQQIGELTTSQQQLSTSASELRNQLNQTNSSNQSLVAKWQKSFTDAQDNRAEDYREALDEAREELATTVADASNQLQKELEQHKIDAKAVIADLEEFKKEAGEIVGYIANKETAEFYKDLADSEKQDADKFRYVAIGGYIGAFLTGLLWVLISIELETRDDSWHTVLLKWTVSIALVGAAAYAQRESSNHRKRQTDARRTELTLRVAGPYVAALDEPIKHEFLYDTARHLFLSKTGVIPAIGYDPEDEEVPE